MLEEDVDEENIYEVMKAHMRRQKEELEAKNAQLRQQQRAAGRPGPGNRPPAAATPEQPVIQKVADLADLPAIWSATRQYLHSAARYLESVLGHCCKIHSLDPATNDAVLLVPAVQRGFTNEKARAKIEEALRAVTDRPLKLTLQISDEEPTPTQSSTLSPQSSSAPAATAQRIPPEVIEAVKEQPLVKQLMKNLDATVVHIEMLNTDE
ncbi:MAG TPA: hypothetical protein VM008_19365 [Phycisphaerae bacterium]|nr:hypothetical protein [Phycisphaerae bacterium]